MRTIKQAYANIRELFDAGEITGTIHTGEGQEAVDKGVIDACIDAGYNPFVVGNHRSYGQYLQFESESKLIGELKEHRGQHLHLPGKMITTGIQGGMAAFAVGVAVANSKLGNDDWVLCFVGDGTLGQGSFYEALAVAATLGPRITFIIVDNEYSMSKTRMRPNVMQLGHYFKMPIMLIDKGWHYITVYRFTQHHFNNWDGAGIIYIRTKRLAGHSCSDTQTYRTDLKDIRDYESRD